MIEAQGLTKQFNGQPVLRGIDLRVRPGECVGITGANGVGKTTLLRVLATLCRPDGGSVRIDGLDLASQAVAVRRRIGFLSHQPLLYDELSAWENLVFYGRMYGVADLEIRIRQHLERVGLQARRHDLVRTFSRGMRQRLGLARVLLHDPCVLLLDEPHTGLDEQANGWLDNLLATGAGAQRSIVFTTHDAGRARTLGHRVVRLVDGVLVEAAEHPFQTLGHAQVLNQAGLAGGAG